MPVMKHFPQVAAARLGRVFCRECGADNRLEFTADYSGLKPCTACQKPPVSEMELLVGLGLSSEEFVGCRGCKAPLMNPPFCYFCGTRVCGPNRT